MIRQLLTQTKRLSNLFRPVWHLRFQTTSNTTKPNPEENSTQQSLQYPLKEVLPNEIKVPQSDLRRQENVSGEFYVTKNCINCDTCRWMAPSVFAWKNGQSAVANQPGNDIEELAALRAAVSCPVGAIQTETLSRKQREVARTAFPIPVPEAGALGVNVYRTGFHSRKSFGACPYLVVSERGNILVDSPRFNSKLASALQTLGGVKYIYLTHVDDVADHARWANHFNATRIIHRTEANGDLEHCERILEGEGPWTLEEYTNEVVIYFQPGHTVGHTVLVIDGKVAFTGDHIAHSHKEGKLRAFPGVCWFSLEVLAKSCEFLRDELGDSLKLILPGHGRLHRSDNMADDIDGVIDHLRQFM